MKGLVERVLSHDSEKGITLATEQSHHAFGSGVFGNDFRLGPALCHQYISDVTQVIAVITSVQTCGALVKNIRLENATIT